MAYDPTFGTDNAPGVWDNLRLVSANGSFCLVEQGRRYTLFADGNTEESILKGIQEIDNRKGLLCFKFTRRVSEIKIVSPISDNALKAIGKMIVKKGESQALEANGELLPPTNELLFLSASTSYFTGKQAIKLVNAIHKYVDLFEAILFLVPRILAPEVVPKNLVKKWLSVEEENRLSRELGQYALLSWNNPTGHYTLDM